MAMRTACNRYRILVVEDDTLVSSYIAEVLVTLEFAVIGCASSGPEAIGLAERDLPDLALVDIRLSGPMDGGNGSSFAGVGAIPKMGMGRLKPGAAQAAIRSRSPC